MRSGIAHGVCNELMSFRFSGSNYYLVPTAGSFQEFKKSFAVNNSPKTATSTAVDIGVPFVGAYERVYTYLGAFTCTGDSTYDPNGNAAERVNYTDNTVHLYYGNYPTKFNPNCDNFSVSKSKMNVKRPYDPSEGEITTFDMSKAVAVSDSVSKGSYGIGHRNWLRVDLRNNTVKFVEKEKVNDGRGMCFWR